MARYSISREIFSRIFGKLDTFANQATEEFSPETSSLFGLSVDDRTDEYCTYQMASCHQICHHLSLDAIDQFVSSKLKEIEDKFKGGNSPESEGCFLCDEVRRSSNSWSPAGRLGPVQAMFDVSTNIGSLIIDCDRLGISSHSGFSSIKASVGVFKGKWQYEVMLNTKGVMQVGWATQKCRFSQEKGVGDTEDSYSYDGSRVRKWNLNTFAYGENWQPGDVIGCTIDLEDGTIDFYRNGKHLGLAFNRIRAGPGIVYFPAVSLAYNESLMANFGATPIKYPVPGYQPLQEIPYSDVAKADVLLTWTVNLIKYQSQCNDGPTAPAGLNVPAPGMSLSYFLIGNIIIQKLNALVRNKYVVEACLLRKLLSLRDSQEIHSLLCLLWSLLEKQQLEECLEALSWALINGYRYSTVLSDSFQGEVIGLHETTSATSYSTSTAFYVPAIGSSSLSLCPINFSAQRKYLLVFLSLIQHSLTRNYLLKHILFDKVKFPLILDIKPVIDEEVLQKALFPALTPSTLLAPNSGRCLKNEAIESAVSEVESLHQMILDTLIFQDEMCRIIFLSKFDLFVKENNNSNPIRLSTTASPQLNASLPVILSFFHRLTSLIRIQYENMINVLPVSFFVESSCVSNDVTRIGGLVTHLVKSYEKDLNKYIETSSSMNPLLKHVYILIDGLIRLYSAGAHKMLTKHCAVRDNVIELMAVVSSQQALQRDEYDSTRQITINVLERELLTKSRQVAWINSTVLSNSKRMDICWLFRLLLNSLEHASSSGTLFSFIPDYYIDSCLNLAHAVRHFFAINNNESSSNAVPSSEDCLKEQEDLMRQFGNFLCSNFGDERVANSDIKDNLAQALASLISKPETLRIVETVAVESRIKMIRNLIQPYENRAWAHSNWILLRFWKGCGFAFRYTQPPNLITKKLNVVPAFKDSMSSLNYTEPCPSEVFQAHLRDYLAFNRSAADSFVASLVSQLNWSFSEFIGMLQEIQNAANKPEKVFIDSRQLKICCTCFDLTVALLRVLEMVVSINPLLMTKPASESSDLLLGQLCTLLNQILSRVTTVTGCFEFVAELDIPGLEPVAHFPLVSAVCGILVSLTVRGPQESRDIAVKAFVSDASFVAANLSYLKRERDSDDGLASTSLRDEKRFKLSEFSEVTSDEADQLEEVIAILLSHNQAMQSSASFEEISEDDICTICYADKKNATFVPCNHQSCRSCITMHLSRHQECFFCKVQLDHVLISDSSQVLYPKTK
ncbi:putative E3 ubiquitin-protein ligase [Halotydeus destructor]|nr:putative E3 ubiquitin-protein ligase [Halotydeus destructor]